MYPLKTKAPYNPDNLAATWSTYTTVYLGNYVTGDFGEGNGSHPGVDIVPMVKHDNIYACLDGVVFFAGFKDMDGNFVVLKHTNVPDPNDLSKTTTLYSSHLHMNSLNVKTGDVVKEGDILGQCGNTGNSTGEHLHFQIDTNDAPFHPYWPFTYKDSQAAGLGFMESVNKGLGIENARKYTVNPLVYLDNVSAHRGSSPAPAINLTPIPAFETKSKYFKDVSDNIEEIDYLYSVGVTKGYSDGTFRPESNISRAELVKMIYKFKKLDAKGNGITFSDVSDQSEFYPYISSASSKGFIKGYSDGTFRPDNAITRAEAMKVVLNIIIGESNIATPADSDFQDVSLSDWFCKYTNFVAQNGLLDAIGKFYPNDNLKRKDLAVVLYNLKDRV